MAFAQLKAQSQKRVVKHNNVSQVSDRPTCLTFCCNKMSKNAEWVNSENLFFHLFRMQSQCKPNAERRELALKSYAEVQPDFAMQRYKAKVPKSKFFRHLISHLESFLYLRMGIQPFIYGLFRAFFTREKKWNRDITFYLMPIIKTYEAATFDLTPMLQPPHLFATDPS